MTDQTMTPEQALEWLEGLRNTTGDQVCAEIEAGKAAETAQAFRAALEAAREDAERYRWLKQHAFCGVWHRGDGLALVAPRVIQREVDAAIDAAMQRTSGGDHADS